MSRLLMCISALFAFAFPVQAQQKDEALSPGVIARFGEVRYPGVGRVFSLVFAPDGKTLLAGAWDGSIRLWDVATGKEIRQFPGHKGWVWSVAFSPDGKAFASGGKDKIIRIWEPATGKELRRLEGHQSMIGRLTYSPDGKLLASLGENLRLWDTATGREVRRLDSRPGTGISSLAFSPDGKSLAFGGVNTTALFDLAAGKKIRQFKTPPRSWYNNLAFSPDGKTLYGFNGNWSSTIYLWDVATGAPLRPLDKPGNHISGFALARDGRSMALTGSDHAIRIHEVITRQERCRFQSPDKYPSKLAFSPDGRILAQGSEDITVLLWDLAGLGEKGRLRPTKLSAKELQALWADLAAADAVAAYRAIWKLAAGSTDSVPFIREHLRPVPPADANAISQFVADLDSDRFETRQHATGQLEKVAELAEPALRRALQDKPPLERRQRIDRLLEKVVVLRDTPSPERLRMLRALEALEHMDTPAAQRVLEQYANGEPAADLTNEAKAALARRY
jgi:WD40 repeat protein